ncbi:MAG: hypothetical protein ACXWVE_11075 [Rhodoplanes sp.]|jgi:hypothetical protein
MSSLTADRLYGLLPAIYRLRDADQGEPLRALLAALATEFAALEESSSTTTSSSRPARIGSRPISAT